MKQSKTDPPAIYAIWAEARLDGPLQGRSGFLSEDGYRLFFTSDTEMDQKIQDLRGLCLNRTPAVTYHGVAYPGDHDISAGISVEQIKACDLRPDFDSTRYEITQRIYGNTGGGCMVGTLAVRYPELEKTLWIHCNDEGVSVSSADYVWNEDHSGSWAQYEDVSIMEIDFWEQSPEDAGALFPAIQDTVTYTIQQAVQNSNRPFRIPAKWLPEAFCQTTDSEYNLLHLINKYMDIYKADPKNLPAKAKAEKYAKILSKTLINTTGDSSQYGQNAYFYDAAEGLLTSMLLLVAEYLPTEDAEGKPIEERHIVSVFKLVQELLAPSGVKGKNQFQLLLTKLPPDHKAKWFAGAALNTSEQAMMSVISTVLSRLNAFLDSEMEQILCFDTAIDAETFCNKKSAIFIVLPEEDQTKYFMVSLILQNLYREILTVADENGGRLKNRVVFFADELGTCPPIQSLELMFSASRSRGLMLVPIVQSITGQLQKNYGREGSEVIVDNCQVLISGGFAPASQTAVELSKALGSRTVMSGSISRGKNDPSQSLQMIERPLMTPDELKSMPKGSFIVAKTGVHPMQVRLRLFLDWGIKFDKSYEVPERAQRPVAYASKQELEAAILRKHYAPAVEDGEIPQAEPPASGGEVQVVQADDSPKDGRRPRIRR